MHGGQYIAHRLPLIQRILAVVVNLSSRDSLTFNAIDEAWEEFDAAPGEELEIPVTIPSKQLEVTQTIAINCKMLDWVQAFCNAEHWGGFLETTEMQIAVALNGAADRSLTFVLPDRVVTIEGEALSLEKLLDGWDRVLPELIGRHTRLAATWKEFQAVRTELLPHLGKLIYQARSWLDGRPEILSRIRRYLELAADLYRETQEHFQVMVSYSADWARAALEALLALDIVQVRVRLPNGKLAAKAVLEPTALTLCARRWISTSPSTAGTPDDGTGAAAQRCALSERAKAVGDSCGDLRHRSTRGSAAGGAEFQRYPQGRRSAGENRRRPPASAS